MVDRSVSCDVTGDGGAVEIAPEVFELGDDVATCDEDPGEALRHSVEAAVAACPRQAISVAAGGA
ncbi:ferredoxin [Mycobacterium colombiense]|uniref:ferredoxin n=1 Tax=Mycobacterium colombiense TaxID=339268 RepID=UPI0007EF1D87|nr:ferredoxin [Mycobacterium colombiense]OBK69528.1 ferredoxin [Mycobacterium colombiense]